MAFKIFVDSSSDMPTALRRKLDIDYFRMGLVVNGEVKFADIDFIDYTVEEMYGWLSEHHYTIKTSLVTPGEFMDKMRPYLDNGMDILYLGCTLALSSTLNVFFTTRDMLLEEYPNRKIIGINTTKADMAIGLMAIEVAKLRDEGKSIEEAAQWVEDNKQHFHEVGSVETLSYLKAAGRVSGTKAFFGNMMHVKPLIMFDIYGHNYVYKSVRGTKKSLEESFEYIKAHYVPGVTDVVYVGQAMAKDQQEYLAKRITEELQIPVEKFWIGPIVGLCCGPGMYGCWFRGDLITETGEKK